MTSLVIALALLFIAPQAQAFDHGYAQWQQLITRHTAPSSDGMTRVDFAALQAPARAELNAVTQTFSNVTITEYAQWSADQRKAFLINAHNAFAIAQIAQHWPIEKLSQLDGWFKKARKQDFFTLLGKTRHLTEIENDFLRLEFKDLRVPFALTYGTLDSPRLARTAYTAAQLEKQLNEAEEYFLKFSGQNQFDASNLSLRVARLFKIYATEIIHRYTSLPVFLAPRMAHSKDEEYAIADPKVRVFYQEQPLKVAEWKRATEGAHP